MQEGEDQQSANNGIRVSASVGCMSDRRSRSHRIDDKGRREMSEGRCE